jgi:AcrR family transcriptional regulator
MGIVERRYRDRQRRIAEIISAAKKIFLSKGFAGATMNDIADHSDLSRRTIYHYFRSKEELSLAAAADTLDQLLIQIDEIHGSSENGNERLKKILSIYRQMYQTDPGGFQFIIGFSESLHVLGHENEQVIICLSRVESIVAAISQFIIEGIVDGSVRNVADPKRTSAVLVSLVHSAIQNAVTNKDVVRLATSCPAEEFLDETFSIFKTYLSVHE